MEKIFTFLIYFMLIIASIIIHEWSHGMVAYLRGDPTAKILGRLSLNPLKHIDPFGTVVLPLVLYFSMGVSFGWAKPVPIDQRRLYYPRFDMILATLAGPLSNFILSFLGFWVFLSLPSHMVFAKEAMIFFTCFNISIGLFNLVPILPLDGGRIVGELLPRSLSDYWYKLEPMGLFIVFGIFIILPRLETVLNVNSFDPKTFLLASMIIILDKYGSILGGTL